MSFQIIFVPECIGLVRLGILIACILQSIHQTKKNLYFLYIFFLKNINVFNNRVSEVKFSRQKKRFLFFYIFFSLNFFFSTIMLLQSKHQTKKKIFFLYINTFLFLSIFFFFKHKYLYNSRVSAVNPPVKKKILFSYI